jgi:hypothetical protein
VFDADRHECRVIFLLLIGGRNAVGSQNILFCSIRAAYERCCDVDFQRVILTRILRLVYRGSDHVHHENYAALFNDAAAANSDVTQPVISSAARGDRRPIWELLYSHYVVLKGLEAPHVQAFAQQVRPEGGGGDYGPNSGGFDQLGYGTLTFTLR